MIKKLTVFSYLSLGTLPLLKPHHNSLIIIVCVIFTALSLLKEKRNIKVNSLFFILISPFVVFLLHQVFQPHFSFEVVLLNLPFLAFPFIMANKPSYIDEDKTNTSLLIFQVSALVQCALFLFVFLKSNNLNQLFFVSLENIPLFREFVFENGLVSIHPTYFSLFLLASFTISIFTFSKAKVFHSLNSLLVIFFLVLLSSRMVILLFFISSIAYGIYYMFYARISLKLRLGLFLSLLLLLVILVSTSTIFERFEEIKTEISKPIKGDYYNSSNTRLAILKCDWYLIKQVPFFGFGNDLQTELNRCYALQNDSNFYTLNTYNTHNYFIHLLLFGGWGMLVFFLFFIVFIVKKLQHSKLALLLCCQILLLNFTENVLVRHYGLVMFTYFVSLFIYSNEKRNSAIRSI